MQKKHSSHSKYNALTLMSAAMMLHAAAQAAPPENGAATTLRDSALSGIRVNEIFQRDMPQNTATVTLRLDTSAVPTSVFKYYSISVLDPYGTRSRVLAEGSYTGANLLSFALSPQSDFSRIRVSFYYANNVEGQRWDSKPFNVGEVFLVAGQSNAANNGQLGVVKNAPAIHRAVDPLKASATDATAPGMWTDLTVQMPYATGGDPASSYAGSPWSTFASSLGTRLASAEGSAYPIPVAVLDVAYGGSALEFWQLTDGEPYGTQWKLFPRLQLGGNSLKRLDPSGATICSFRAVLWHQGEANAERDFTAPNYIPNTRIQVGPANRKTYAGMMTQLARDFRTQTACAQPWVVATATWESAYYWSADGKVVADKFRAETEIRKGQRYLWSHARADASEPVFKPGPDTDLYNGEFNGYGAAGYRYDGVHMSADGLAIHGNLWAERVGNIINAGITPSTEANRVASVVQSFKNQLGRQDDEIEFDNEGIRYWLQTTTTSGANVDSALAGSDERYLRDVFQNTVGRRPAWWEANYWVSQLATRAVTRAELSASNRVGYENTLSPNGRKVFRLYVNVMGRSLPDIQQDAGGMAYWTGILDNNQATEAGIADTFRASAEYRVRNAFVKSFGRQPNQTELNKYFSSAGSYTDAALAQEVWNRETP